MCSDNYPESTNNDPLFTSVFIGNTGVGKTSILSAMYMALDDANLSSCGLSLLPKTEDEFQLLKGKWREMQKHIRKQRFGSTIKKPLYQGTKGTTNHDFVLSGNPTDQNTGLPIRIWDTEGGYTANTNPALIAKVAHSFVVMCAVDATFLMEFDSESGVNEEMNEVRSIKQILERALNQQDSGILSVFFLITKCEKYMKNDASRNQMAAKFNIGFRSVLELLRQKHIMVHYLPVQTMGCVELARIEECEDGWSQEFQVVLGKTFDYTDAVQPLSLLLQLSLQMLDMILQKQWEDRPWWEVIWDTITFKDAPERLDGLVQAISEHFGAPKDWRTNRDGALAEVVLVNQ